MRTYGTPSRGATAIAAERLDDVPQSVARVHVHDARMALATFASRFVGHPAADLRLIGFTGTFGKTSTSDVLRVLLAGAGWRAGVIGSLGATFEAFHDAGNGLTTPAPVELHRALRAIRNAGGDTVIIEVTSHALRLRRVEGLAFAGGLLAAIRPGEHTDFHRTYEDYVGAKRIFLDYLSLDAILAYDADNPASRDMAASRHRGRSVGFSLEGRDAADLTLSNIALDASGARFVIDGPLAGSRRALHSTLLGSGHLRNVALALTYTLAHGVNPGLAADVLGGLQPLSRRMERYTVDGRTVLDDTAAHPESFGATFAVAALLPRERLVVVYAVRGNRGTDINRRNAETLAELAAEFGVDAFILTASQEATGPADRVRPQELAAARDGFTAVGRPFIEHETLDGAIQDALARTSAGDLIVLIGAQGMNGGKARLTKV